MKKLKSRTILLISSLSYFISTALWSFTGDQTVLSDGLRILGLLCLVFGILSMQKERSVEKNIGNDK